MFKAARLRRQLKQIFSLAIRPCLAMRIRPNTRPDLRDERGNLSIRLAAWQGAVILRPKAGMRAISGMPRICIGGSNSFGRRCYAMGRKAILVS